MEKIVWKSIVFFNRTCSRFNYFWKEKNVVVSKKRLKSHQDSIVCYICRKKLTQKVAKDKNHQKIRDIVILLINADIQHILFVIYDLKCPKTKTIILSKRESETSLKVNLNVLEKLLESTKLFSFQQKKKLENLIKMIMKILRRFLSK